MPDRNGIETQVMAAPTVGQPKASPASPSLNADLQPLVNQADLAYQRAEVAIGTYAAAPKGTAGRELYDRVMLGERVDDVAMDLRSTKGLLVPAEDRAYLKEYQDKRFISGPRIELSESVAAHVYSPKISTTPGVYATPMDGSKARLAIQDEMTGDQLHAIEEHQGKVNTRLFEAAGVLATLEADGGKGTPAYEQALKEYEKLRYLADPNPAAVQLGQARSQAQERLKAIAEDPSKATTLSPALKRHWEQVAQGGGTPGIPGGLGTGIPRPLINGRFAGMENSKDLALTRQEIAQTALLAQPGAPNADRLVASLRFSPKDTGLDNAALQKMWEDRRASMAAHQTFLNTPASPGGDALAVKAEHLTALGASGVGPIALDRPAFVAAGPVSPIQWSEDGRGVAYMKDGADQGSWDLGGNAPGGPSGPDGGAPGAGGPGHQGPNDQGPAGPGAGGPTSGGPEAPLAPSSPNFLSQAPRRIATVSPETHSASVLEGQIRAVEQATRARIRTMQLMTAATVVGTAVLTSAEIAMEVASAPMNPNADPARALMGVGQGVNTVTREVIGNHRQMVHERTKADSDIRRVIDTHTREQRQHAGEWAEKMSNQLGHLDQIKPGVAALDQAEIRVGEQVVADPAFKAQMTASRDHWAFDTHLAAANEMAMASHEGLKAQGSTVALFLQQNRDRLQGKSWDEISKALLDKSAMVNVTTPGRRDATLTELDATGAYQTVLTDLDRQHQTQMVQEAVQQRLVSGADAGTLHEAVGADLAQQLGAKAAPDHLQGPSTEGPASITGAQMAEALNQKHTVERSIQASWRDFTARAPIHAERVVQGGMDPNRLLAQLYDRQEFRMDGPAPVSPEQEAVGNLHKHFLEVRHKPGAGVPEGWGESTTLGGDKVGIAPSPNGGSQALLVGFDPKTNQAQGVAIHLFAGERVQPPARLEALPLDDATKAAFLKELAAQPVTAGPHAVVSFDKAEMEALKLNEAPAPGAIAGMASRWVQSRYTGAPDAGYTKAANEIESRYNETVKAAYTKHASAQLEADALTFAKISSGKVPGSDEFNTAKEGFIKAYGKDYTESAATLARREFLDKASAMTIAVQLKASSSYGAFHQVVEGNRGHFNYKPHEVALDADPRRALEGGKGGSSEGRDFRRMMDQADGIYQSMPDEISRGREKGVTAFKYGLVNHLSSPLDYMRHKDTNPDFLRELSPKSAQAKAILDDPIRQSQIARLGHTRAASTHQGMDGADRFRGVSEYLKPGRKSA